MPTLRLALVHHANQCVITNGYQSRSGLDETVGGPDTATGYWRILALHRRHRVPLALHLSGTLLEALAWHRPDFLALVRALLAEGIVELIGSSYAQNIMRFFDRDHNRRQLTEALALYRDVLGVDPATVKVFWPPERVWDTGRLAAVIADPTLPNGGYTAVVLDDRLLHAAGGPEAPRACHDRARAPQRADFAVYEILDGQGLRLLPIARWLRHGIPPAGADDLVALGGWLQGLAAADAPGAAAPVALYGDDLEKAAGVGGWDARGPARYEALLGWVAAHPGLEAVALRGLTDVAGVRRVDVGTFLEMSTVFGAGEGYERWWDDPQWAPYRSAYTRAETRVRAAATAGADPALIDLAWKQLLVSTWETAWQTPPSGVHGDPAAHGAPSPWIRATAAHVRVAPLIAESAAWMRTRDDRAHADLVDLDDDGEAELVLRGAKLFAVLSPRWGGRLVYLFSVGGPGGRLVIGNPCDDWNWMEETHKYMEVPANHPGALVDRERPHDRFEAVVEVGCGSAVRVRLTDREPGSAAYGLEKTLVLPAGADEIEVTYHLPPALDGLTVECGLSPDYQRLLRRGRPALEETRGIDTWACTAGGTSAWVRLDAPFGPASARDFGHGRAVTFAAPARRFRLWVGARQRAGALPDG